VADDVALMEQWVVYERPLDYPRHFVVRKHEIGRGWTRATHDVHLADSLINARRLVPAGFARIPRCSDDDPHIVEVWV
jgi:hypothetical protein